MGLIRCDRCRKILGIEIRDIHTVDMSGWYCEKCYKEMFKGTYMEGMI